jgi:hypothetical protein
MEPGRFLLAIGRPAAAGLAAIGIATATAIPATAEPTAPVAAEAPSPRAGGDVPMHAIGGAGFSTRAAGGDRHVVMVQDEVALQAALSTGVSPIDVWRHGIHGFVTDLDDAQVRRLRATAGVVSVEPDGRLAATGQQSNPPWGLDRIDQTNLPLDGSYTYPGTGLGVTAYVIDTGIWASHTEFAGRIPYGFFWDFGDGTDGWDCSGHGTHVAGTLGGTTYGVAKEVWIVPVKVLNCAGEGPTSAMLGGIEAIIEDHQAGVPAVANLSVGGPPSPEVDAAVEAMIADGITVVAAAGNTATDSCLESPGRVPDVITVAASTQNDDDAEFSNVGPCNDLFAPGVDVLSAWWGDDTATGVLSGTSMASPHVAGVAALVVQSMPWASPAEVWATIEQASTKGVLSECCGDPDQLLFVPPLNAPPPPPPALDLATVQPARLYDSRSGPGPRPAGSITEIQVGGVGGVPADAPLAALNVTAVEPAEPGYFTVFPCASALPNASNLNFRGGQTIPNSAVVRIGAGGRVCVYTSATSGLLVDVNGFAPAGSRIAALDPFRLFDSRAAGSPRPAGSVTEVQVAGAGGVDPAATAALLNVTAVDALSDGYMTVFPCGTNPPNASNLNFRAGQTVANAVFGRIGAGGKVCVFTSSDAGVIVDVNAGVPPAITVDPVDPFRLHDSRQLGGPALAGSVTSVQVAGLAGVPLSATTALLNVTALEAGDTGYVTVFPCGTALPNASNLNFAAGDTIPNAVIAKLGGNGAVCVYTSAAAGLLVDVNGYAT